MTTEECLALAVLKGDLTAARALADLLVEQDLANEVRVLPALKVTGRNTKAFIFYNSRCSEERKTQVYELVRDWLDGEYDVVGLAGVDRIELYEFPDQS